MSTRSTMIKDLRPPSVAPSSQIKTEEDIAVQEVLSEIDREHTSSSGTQQMFAPQASMVANQGMLPSTSPLQNDPYSNQLLQQQLLQQQLLQQQLLQQHKHMEHTNMFNNLVCMFKNTIQRDNNLLLLSTVLFLIFTYVDVLKLIKIDNFSLFEKYPTLINLVTAIIFGLTLVVVKTLM